VWGGFIQSKLNVTVPSCIPDSYWTGNQRHHQYAVNYTGTWRNTALQIDASRAMGLTAGSHHYDDPNGVSACP